MAGLLDEPYIGYPQLRRSQSLLGGTPRGLLNTSSPQISADTLRKLGEQLINIPTSATRAITDPQLFARLLGITPNQQLSGFSAGYAGLPAKPPSDIGVVDPRNIDYSKGYSSGEEMGMMTALAAPLAPLARPVGRAVGEQAYRMTEGLLQRQGLMPSITAYHGTPYNIQGKFDINKVGTGEGAQAYGYGMYYAENPAVAKQYATDRSYVGKVMAGTPDNTPWNAQRIAQDTLNVHGDNAVEQLQKTLKANSQLKNSGQLEANKQIEDAIDILKTNQLQPTGNLYKVDIPDEYIPKMLDYDKPLSQHPKSIQDALDEIVSKDALGRPTGETLDKSLNGRYAYEKISGLRSAKLASQAMQDAGIKGIRYLDEGSRSAGKGTSNFVVFDPADVKILEKNSQKVEGLLD